MTSRAMLILAAATLALTATTAARAGDAAAGEKDFRKCKACHTIANGDDVIYKGGKTGPNLYGVIGRKAGSEEGFNYGDDIVAAGEAGLVWDGANIAEYVHDPKEFLAKTLDKPSARTKMSFKLRDGGEDVAAYLASVAK